MRSWGSLGWKIHCQTGSVTRLSIGYWLPDPLHIGLLVGKISSSQQTGLRGFTWQFKTPEASLTREQGRICMVFFLSWHSQHYSCYILPAGAVAVICMGSGRITAHFSTWEECHSCNVRKPSGIGESIVLLLEESICHTADFIPSSLFIGLPLGFRRPFHICSWKDLPVPGKWHSPIALNQFLTDARVHKFHLASLPGETELHCLCV